MLCDEFEDRLNRLLDSRVAPGDDARLTAHAQSCDRCASSLAAQERLFVGLRQSRPQLADDFADRVMSLHHQGMEIRKGARRKLGWSLLIATAASLAGLAVFMSQGSPDQNQIAQPPALSSLPKPNVREVRETDDAEPRMATIEESPASERDTDERFDEYFVVIENIALQIGESKQFDEVSETLTPSFRPIRSSFGLAIDALRRTLPRGKEQRGAKPDDGARYATEVQVLV